MWNRVGAVELQSGATTAVVVPALGMLVASLVVDGVEFIARPGGLGAYRAGHTTAVPLLYPWANRLARRSYRAADVAVSLRGLPLHTDANRLPIHGTMMTARPDWEVIALGAGRMRARFDFGAHSDLLASFPFPHELEVSVSVARGRLRVQTAVRASGGCAVPVSFGWHPYWRVPGSRESWTVRLPDVAHLRLDRRGIPTGASNTEARRRVPLRGQELDDLYAFSGPRRSATLEGGGRRLRLDLDAGYPYLQIYAPAAGRFCCLEPMTAPTNALVTGDHRVVPAGESFTATFSARVS
jgi:Galactose mutarotase and related enzymes